MLHLIRFIYFLFCLITFYVHIGIQVACKCRSCSLRIPCKVDYPRLLGAGTGFEGGGIQPKASNLNPALLLLWRPGRRSTCEQKSIVTVIDTWTWIFYFKRLYLWAGIISLLHKLHTKLYKLHSWSWEINCQWVEENISGPLGWTDESYTCSTWKTDVGKARQNCKPLWMGTLHDYGSLWPHWILDLAHNSGNA